MNCVPPQAFVPESLGVHRNGVQMTTPKTEPGDRTSQQNFRLPLIWWTAFGRVCDRLGVTRTARILEHIKADLRDLGDDQDRADLATGEQELAERRSRKGGRPARRPGHDE